MIDYIEVISKTYPDYGVSSTNTTMYSAIDWQGETVISQATLDADWLVCYKTMHIEDLSLSAQTDIFLGFSSSALGTAYWYDGKYEDQLNLIGAEAAGDTMDYPCRDDSVSAKVYRAHTNAQLVTVVQSGRDVKLDILQTFNTKKGQVEAAVDQAAVDAITW